MENLYLRYIIWLNNVDAIVFIYLYEIDIYIIYNREENYTEEGETLIIIITLFFSL